MFINADYSDFFPPAATQVYIILMTIAVGVGMLVDKRHLGSTKNLIVYR